MQDDGQLAGKVALITGGASGIGAGTAKLFAERGAHVVVADLQADKGEPLAAQLDGMFVQVDVTREEQVSAAVDAAVERFGRLDCVFNNAGFGGALGPIDEISEDDYNITFDVLLKGVFFGVKHAARVMKPQGSGSIVNTASINALLGGYGPHLYSTAKAAVIGLTRTTALEMAEYNVRVNAVCPGFIVTALSAGLDADAAAMDKFRDDMAGAQPMGRVGEPRDIAEMVAFLASDGASFVTGQAHVVDGGVVLGKPWRKQPRFQVRSRPISVYRPPDR